MKTQQDKENRFYVYLHRRKSDGRIFYVGKGQAKRAWNFKEYHRSDWWNRVYNKYGCIVEIKKSGMAEDCALTLEKILIHVLRISGHPLVNLTEGGEGTTGYRFNDEVKGKISSFAKCRLEDPRDHPRYNPEEFTWWNLDGSLDYGDVVHMSVKYSLPIGSLRKVSSGGMYSYKGWKVAGVRNYPERGGIKNNTSDDRVFCWNKKGFPNFIGCRSDFSIFYGYNSNKLYSLLSGKSKTMDGWKINEI